MVREREQRVFLALEAVAFKRGDAAKR